MIWNEEMCSGSCESQWDVVTDTNVEQARYGLCSVDFRDLNSRQNAQMKMELSVK